MFFPVINLKALINPACLPQRFRLWLAGIFFNFAICGKK
jgi:hypothetical protein